MRNDMAKRDFRRPDRHAVRSRNTCSERILLNEVRGASARLDWLNRDEMERVLSKEIANVEKIYANGGSAQFLVRECSEIAVPDRLPEDGQVRSRTNGR